MSDKKQSLGITVKKTQDISEWYTQIITKAGLADFSPIQGCMIIKPNGYGMWEQMQNIWNQTLKELGVKNVYFPMFIPESLIKKEEDHVEGFKAEVAWIEKKPTDHEKYCLRPTSETIMYHTYAQWIRSHRDLPLKLNQWANIVRWETSQTRPFLRTREFLWHEGHNAFATAKEAQSDAMLMINEYQKFVQDELAIPVLVGKKAESEKFPGAVTTFTMEGMSPDGKAIQAGTSHDLGDHFAKVFDIQYTGDDGKKHYAHQTSWGWTTRLIGAMILIHGDDKGMVMPPRVATNQVIVIPICMPDTKKEVMAAAEKLTSAIAKHNRVTIDTATDKGPGFRFSQAELEGIPIRIELGPKDLQNDSCVVVRRDTGEKLSVPLKEAPKKIEQLLKDIQENMFGKAKKILDESIVDAKDYAAFKKAIESGKMVRCWTSASHDAQVKAETAATPRVIPIDQPSAKGHTCIFTGKPAQYLCYYARSY